jgi:hypothetical protein
MASPIRCDAIDDDYFRNGYCIIGVCYAVPQKSAEEVKDTRRMDDADCLRESALG